MPKTNAYTMPDNDRMHRSLFAGGRLFTGQLQSGRGTALDELLAVLIFIVVPIDFTATDILRYPAIALTLLLAILAWRDMIPILRRGWYFFILPALCLLSVLWSNYTYETVRFAGYMAIALVMTAYLAVRLSHRQIIVAVLIAKLLLALGSLVYLERTFVGGIDGGWAILGLYPHKNVVGMHMLLMIVAAFAILLDHHYRKLWRLAALPAIGLGFFFILNALSATAIVLTIIGIGAVTGLGGIWRPAAHVKGLRPLIFCSAIIIACAGVMAISSFTQADPYTFILEKLNKDTSLTGRTDIWLRAQELVEEKPVLGVGADGFWRPGLNDAAQITRQFTTSTKNTFNFHNTFYEVTVHIGLVGFAIFVFTMVMALKTLVLDWWRNQRVEDPFFIVLTILLLSRAVTESELFSFMTFGMILFWTGVFVALRRTMVKENGVQPSA